MLADKIRLTAKEILEKEFKTGMRGYNQEEVDKYLDSVIKDYEAFHEEIEALQNKLNHFMDDAETKQEIIYKLQRKLEIRQLGEKACDRNDEALKKMEE